MATQWSCALRDCVSSNASLFLGLLLGSLSSGLIMATVTALWVTSSNHNISSTSSTTLGRRSFDYIKKNLFFILKSST